MLFLRICLGALKCARIELLEVEPGIPTTQMWPAGADLCREGGSRPNGGIMPSTTKTPRTHPESRYRSLYHRYPGPDQFSAMGNPNFTIMEAWLPSNKAMALEVEVNYPEDSASLWR